MNENLKDPHDPASSSSCVAFPLGDENVVNGHILVVLGKRVSDNLEVQEELGMQGPELDATLDPVIRRSGPLLKDDEGVGILFVGIYGRRRHGETHRPSGGLVLPVTLGTPTINSKQVVDESKVDANHSV